MTVPEEMAAGELRAAARKAFAQILSDTPTGWSEKYVNGWNDAINAIVDQLRDQADKAAGDFRSDGDSGGWTLEPSVYKPGLTCLVSDEGILIRHEDNPLSPQQMKALGVALFRAAERKGEERE